MMLCSKINLNQALFAFALGCGASSVMASDVTQQAKDLCSDRYSVMFSAKPMGSPLWIAPKEAFVVNLPAKLEASHNQIKVALELLRVSKGLLIARFSASIEEKKSEAFYTLQISVASPQPLTSHATDANGNAWGVSVKPVCLAV